MDVYFIYGLYDPRDKSLRYIGFTRNLTKRLAKHLGKPLRCLREWLAELKAAGLKPTIAVIEETASYWRYRERTLICQHANAPDSKLLNVAGRRDYEAEADARSRRRDAKRREIVERRRMREAIRRINRRCVA